MKVVSKAFVELCAESEQYFSEWRLDSDSEGAKSNCKKIGQSLQCGLKWEEQAGIREIKSE